MARQRQLLIDDQTAQEGQHRVFYIARNILLNNSLEFYLPRLVEMVSDLSM